MKSMLQEASSVAIAIEKAWNNSGNPEEFTIKILELGDKNFWGKTKQPAIISIIYDPKRQSKKIVKKKEAKKVVQKPKINVENVRKEANKKQRSGLLRSLFGRPAAKAKAEKRTAIAKKENGQKRDGKRFDKGGNRKKVGINSWNQELTDQAIAWLKEILHIMSIKANITTRIDNRILNVFLDREVFSDKEEQKLFFIGVSHLLMQFLKKKHKKRLQNFFLILHANSAATNGVNKNTSTGK